MEFHLLLFTFTVKKKNWTNILAHSLLKKLDTLKLHLLRMTLWRTSKCTNLIALLNRTPQFNLASFLSLQDENFKESPFQVCLDLCGPFSKIPCDLWSTQAQSLCHCKASVKGVGLGWVQHCSSCILAGSGIKLPEKDPFFSTPPVVHTALHMQ